MSSKMEDDLEHSISSQLERDMVEGNNDATSEHKVESSRTDRDDVEKDTVIHEQELERSISSLDGELNFFSDSETDHVR